MPPVTKDAVIRPVAVLLCSSAVTADAGGEREEAVAQRRPQEAPQVGAERPDDPAVDHVQAPQQQRHAAHQVEKDHALQAIPLRPDLE